MKFTNGNDFVIDVENSMNMLDDLVMSNRDRQYVAAGGALEAKSIIEDEADGVRLNAEQNGHITKRLQLGKYVDSSVEGHLKDNVYMQNEHGREGYNYTVGFINKTAKVIARFVNDGTIKQQSNPFMDRAKNEIQVSSTVKSKTQERFNKRMAEKVQKLDAKKSR